MQVSITHNEYGACFSKKACELKHLIEGISHRSSDSKSRLLWTDQDTIPSFGKSVE